ncbi:putative leader peptide [Modestobacter sp. Leaf380]
MGVVTPSRRGVTVSRTPLVRRRHVDLQRTGSALCRCRQVPAP